MRDNEDSSLRAPEGDLESASDAHLTFVTFCVLLLISIGYYVRFAPVVLDDVFIYFRVARNTLSGLGPVFNQGDTHLIVTSPMWLFLIVAAKASVQSADFAAISKLLYVLSLAFSSLVLRTLLVDRFPLTAALAPLAVFFAPLFVAFVGLDISLACLLCLTTILVYRRQPRLLPLFAALSYLARGEGVLIGAALFLVWISNGEWRTRLRRTLPWAVLAGALVGGWHLYYLSKFDAFFPSTLSAKVAQGSSAGYTFFDGLGGAFGSLTMGPLLILPVVGLVLLGRKAWPLALWPLLHVIAYSAIGVAVYHWYYYPLYLVGNVAILVAAEALFERAAASVVRPLRLVALFLVALLCMPQLRVSLSRVLSSEDAQSPRYALFPELSDWTEARFRSTAEMAIWLTADGTDEGVILTPDIGLLGYLLPEFEIRDTHGLASPDVRSVEVTRWQPFVHRYDPLYLVTMTQKLPEELTKPGATPRYQLVLVPEERYFHSAIYMRVRSPVGPH